MWLPLAKTSFAIAGLTIILSGPVLVLGQPPDGRLPPVWNELSDTSAFSRIAQAPQQASADDASAGPPNAETDSSANPLQPPVGGEDGRIGPRPPEEITRLALRGTSLLLKPGAVQFDFTTMYVRQEQQAIGILPGGIPVLERVRNRTIIAPMSLRYGWKENLEVFATAPFGVSVFEYDSPAINITDQTGVLGDITVGFAHQLPQFRKWPDWTLTFNVTAPTGPSEQGELLDSQASLGNGVWRLGAMINLVESVDPFVFFGGLGYDYPFAQNAQGLTIQYGDSVNLYFGAGVAMTDDISLSAQVNASFQNVTVIEGFGLPNTDIEPVTLRIGLVRRLTMHSRVQPFVAWGLTNDAPDYSVGVRLTHDFGGPDGN